MGNKPGRSRKGTMAAAAVVEAVTVKDLDSVQKTEVLAAPTQGRPRPPQRRRPTASGGGARGATGGGARGAPKTSFKTAVDSVMVTKAAEGFSEKQRSLEERKVEDPADEEEAGGEGVKDVEVKDDTMTGTKTKKFIAMKTPSLVKEPSIQTEVKSESVPNQKRPQSEVFPTPEIKTTLPPKSHSFSSDASSQLLGEPESKTAPPTRSDLPGLEEDESCHDDPGKTKRENYRSKAMSLGAVGESFEEAPLQRKITSPKIAMDLSSVDEEEEIAENDLIQRFMKKQQKLASLIEEETVGGKYEPSDDKEVGDKFAETNDPLEDCNYENATEEVQSYRVAKENVSGEYVAGEKVTTVQNSGERVTTQNVVAVQGAENSTGPIPANEKGTSDPNAGLLSSLEKANKADFEEIIIDEIVEEKDTAVQDAEEKEVAKEVAKEKEVEEVAVSSESAEAKHSAAEASVGHVTSEKNAPEKDSEEKAITEKATKECDYEEKVARNIVAQKKAAEEKSALEKYASEKVAAEKSDKERTAAKKAKTEKSSLEKAAEEKAAEEKVATEKAATEKIEKEKAATEKIAKEKAATEKIAEEKSTAESTYLEKYAEDKSATNKAAVEKVFAEKDAEVRACPHKTVEETVIIDQDVSEKVHKESDSRVDGARNKSTAGKGSSKKVASSISNTDSGGRDSFFSLGVEPDVTDNNLLGI